MRIAIIGGSAAGMFSALLMARAGHEILLIERDELTVEATAEGAAQTAFRIGTPHLVQPHIILPRCRELIAEKLPDIYGSLLASGAVEASLETQMPTSLLDKRPSPGDERLTSLMTRRSTLDWVLRRAVSQEKRVRVQDKTPVSNLSGEAGKVPNITGIRTSKGTINADIVIDAGGYRTRIGDWIEELGGSRPAIERAECGIAYFSRHYRRRFSTTIPWPLTTRILLPLDEFTIGLWSGDSHTVQIAIAPLAVDRRFKAILDVHAFTAVLRTIPAIDKCLDDLDPISDVFAMGSVQNTLRRFIVDGAPVATGVHAVGDSVCTTNPTLGRGLTLALSGAIRLAELVSSSCKDRTERSLQYEAWIDDGVAPFYADQASIDAARLADLRHRVFSLPKATPPSLPANRICFSELRIAAMFHPNAYRAFWRIYGMLQKPEEIYYDSAVVKSVRQVLRNLPSATSLKRPNRDQLIAALAPRKDHTRTNLAGDPGAAIKSSSAG